jgi:hypothetical protein
VVVAGSLRISTCQPTIRCDMPCITAESEVVDLVAHLPGKLEEEWRGAISFGTAYLAI